MNALRLLVVILILPYLCTGFTVARLGFDPLQRSSYLSMNASEKKLPSRNKKYWGLHIWGDLPQ